MGLQDEFWRLLGEAQEAREAVDNFDLDSGDGASCGAFELLCRHEAAAAVMLVSFVALQWNELMLIFTDPERPRLPATPSPSDPEASPEQADGSVVSVQLVPPSVRNVMDERKRQHAKGFDAAHDDKWVSGELAKAGAHYASSAAADGYDPAKAQYNPPFGWPFEAAYWNPEGRRADLVKAAALIIAEIERLDRVAAREDEDAEIIEADRQRGAHAPETPDGESHG